MSVNAVLRIARSPGKRTVGVFKACDNVGREGQMLIIAGELVSTKSLAPIQVLPRVQLWDCPPVNAR